MLQQDKPEDYVIATGETHTVREFVNSAFKHAGIELAWKGNGVDEKGIVRSLSSSFPLALASTSACEARSSTSTLTSILGVGDVLIEIDSRYFRPLEVESL